MERLKERIKLETEVLRFAALLMVATGGGSISLLLGEWTVLRAALAGLGFLSTLILGIVCWRLYKEIRALIEQSAEVPQ